jgi:hypothetical protein
MRVAFSQAIIFARSCAVSRDINVACVKATNSGSSLFLKCEGSQALTSSVKNAASSALRNAGGARRVGSPDTLTGNRAHSADSCLAVAFFVSLGFWTFSQDGPRFALDDLAAIPPGISPSDPKPTKPVPPPSLMQINKLRPNLKTLGGGVLSARQQGGERRQNARKLFATYVFGFGVRRGDCFVSVGSGPPRSAGASGGNLGFDDRSAHLRLRSATSRRRSISPSHHEPRHFWRPTAA